MSTIAQHSTALTNLLSFFSKTYQHAGEFFRPPFLRGDFFVYFGTYDGRKMDEHKLSLIRPPPVITGKFDALINGRDFISATVNYFIRR